MSRKSRSISVLFTLIPVLPAVAACGYDPARAPDDRALEVVFDNAPASLGNQAHTAIAFHVDGGAATTQCALDGAAPVDCTSPFELDAGDGDHTLAVTATADDPALAPATDQVRWRIDTAAPDTAIDQAPAAIEPSGAPSFAFSTGAADADHFECALDGAAFAACTSPVQLAVGDGAHRFAVRAVDAAGNPDPSPAEAAWIADAAAPSITITDGPDGATDDATPSWSFGVTGSPLAVQCRIDDAAFADCGATFTAPALDPGSHTFEITATDALGYVARAQRTFSLRTVYVAANLGFAGVPCFDGIRYSTPNLTVPYALICTEHNGVFKTPLADPIAWTNTTALGVAAPNANGRAIAVNPNGPPVYYVSDATTSANGFRSNNGGDTWTAQSLSNAGTVFDVFSFIFRQSVGNIAGSWDATLGAVVLHGNQPTAMVPHFVGDAPGSVTGTVRGIANGGPKDVYVAVYGQTPAGAAARGGIFRACDLTSTGGGTYTERDAGIPADDRDRVWSLTVDPSSLVSTPFQCGDSTSAGSANTYYAALRGGGQVYKTTDGGVTWAARNTGLPAGAEVYVIAIDCYNNGQANNCPNANLLFAATSVGLYRSGDGGGHWALDGFGGQVVRAVAIHPSATPMQVLVGVDDAVGIYRNATP